MGTLQDRLHYLTEVERQMVRDLLNNKKNRCEKTWWKVPNSQLMDKHLSNLMTSGILKSTGGYYHISDNLNQAALQKVLDDKF